jgi:hypothetical protein
MRLAITHSLYLKMLLSTSQSLPRPANGGTQFAPISHHQQLTRASTLKRKENTIPEDSAMDEEDSLLSEAASSASRLLVLDDRPRTAPLQSRLAALPRDTRELMADAPVDPNSLSHLVAQMHLHGKVNQ